MLASTTLVLTPLEGAYKLSAYTFLSSYNPLLARICTAYSKSMKKTPSSKTISFRIAGKLAGKLRRKALELGQSLHEYAREIFLDALSQQEIRDEVIELQHEIRNLRAELDDLRHDITLVSCKFLVDFAGADEDEIKQWFTLNLSSQNYRRDE